MLVMRAFFPLLILLPVFAVAQTEIPDIDSMSAEEIQSLPPEILKELPFLRTMRKLFSGY